MRILSIESEPLCEIDYLSATPFGQPVRRTLPVMRALVEGLPSGLKAVLATADLQGRLQDPNGAGELRLLGHALADQIESMCEAGELPDPKSLGIILAGDLFTVSDLARMGGKGDVRPIWRDFANRFRWATGVAGNHDLFNDTEKPPLDEAFRSEPNVFFLDDEVIEIDGLKVAGLSGIIGKPTKLWRRSESDYTNRLGRMLMTSPDLVVLHDGPDVPGEKPLLGSTAVRVALESCNSRPLVVRGHCHWDRPLAELENGIQILNVDGIAIVLQSSQ